MAIDGLNHCSIRTTELEATRCFYRDVLGLREGYRPPFKFPGHWLYAGDVAVVHLIGIDPKDAQGLVDYLGDKAPGALAGGGAVDHIAFMASDLAGLRRHLSGLGVPFRERTVPAIGLHQLFVEDPNGVTLELNFAAIETQTAKP